MHSSMVGVRILRNVERWEYWNAHGMSIGDPVAHPLIAHAHSPILIRSAIAGIGLIVMGRGGNDLTSTRGSD